MVALAVLVTQIASDSANGKTDARLDAGLRTATNLFDEDRPTRGAGRDASPHEIGSRRPAMAAIRTGNAADVLSLARDLREPRRDRVRLDHRLVGRRAVAGRLAARSRPPRSTWSAPDGSAGRHDHGLDHARATPTSRRSRRPPARRRRCSARGPGRRRAADRRRRPAVPRAARPRTWSAATSSSGRGDRAARRRAGAGGALRPGRRRGLLRLAAERRDRAGRVLRASRCWRRSRSSSARCRATCGRCSAPRSRSATATSPSGCRSAAATRWRGWRASSTR